MGRKSQHLKSQQFPDKTFKKGKIKRKQMFTELQTPQEEQIHHHSKVTRRRTINYRNQMELQSQNQDIDFNNSNELEQVCETVNKLFSKNKINSKNAFEVPLIDLQTLPDFTVQNDNSWKKLSATLQNDYRIYGYRVDAIHSITYKVLNTMNLHQQDPQIIKQNQVFTHNVGKDFKEGLNTFIKFDEINSAPSFIEKNLNNLNSLNIEYSSKSDPILERTKRQFDQSGLSSMFLNNISLDNELNLQLTSIQQKNRTQFRKKMNIGSLIKQIQSIKIPKQLIKICQQIKNIQKLSCINEVIDSKIFNEIWKIIETNGMNQWANKIQQFQFQNNIFENIQLSKESSQYEIKSQSDKIYQKIKQQIHNNDDNQNFNRIKNNFKKTDQFIEKMQKTMKQNNCKKQNILIKNQLKCQFDQEMDLKNIQNLEEKDQILQLQSQKRKNQSAIQDKFLLPIRLFNDFKIEKVMTLREDPTKQIVVNKSSMEDEYFHHRQIDIRTQKNSIRELKSKLELLLSKKTTFKHLLQAYNCTQDKNISTSLCFLSLLHLANEKNLQLTQISNNNFSIQNYESQNRFQMK